ncbi:MAG: hypothetical protein NXI00_19530 [Cytophagales bacterium]|nr:hypothetical protein [Cytophagales bacterium]
MFVGHYAAAFALKGKEKRASLGMLFIATQFVDILFFPFAVIGIEQLNFVPEFTAVNNFDLAFMPYTHGLLASCLWAAFFYFIYYKYISKNEADRKSVAIVMALGVLSHWFADLIAHTPDLPIIYGEPKLGFGLWRNKDLTFITEAFLLIFSVWYYQRKTKTKKKYGNYAASGFASILILANYLNFYVLPQDSDLINLTISAIASYFIFAGLAWWVDGQRG